MPVPLPTRDMVPVRSVADNLGAFLALAETCPGAAYRTWDDAHVLRMAVPSPAFNAAVLTSHTSPEPLLRFLRGHRRYATWLVIGDPSSTQRTAIEASGCRSAPDLRVMTAAAAVCRTPSGDVAVSVLEASDVAGLWSWAALVAEGFGLAVPEETAALQAVARAVAKSPRADLLLARRGDEPVGAAALVASRGIDGLHDVTTAPAERGRGVATAMVRRACDLARARGEAGLLVAAEPGAVGFWERAGFRAERRIVRYCGTSARTKRPKSASSVR